MGDNFRFGYRQAGNVACWPSWARAGLRNRDRAGGQLPRAGGVVSSGIRQLISAGRVALAARLLERPYSLEGEVVAAAAWARVRPFPPSIWPPSGALIPAAGVYVTRTRDLDGAHASGIRITNIGYRPTFGESDQLTIETFLLDPLAAMPHAGIRVDSLACARRAQIRIARTL